jgi:iron(III) transport system permease protein
LTTLAVVATVIALAPHAVLVLLSLVPANTWTTQVLPPRLSLLNYAALFGEPERLRPTFNSLWMSLAAVMVAFVLALWATRLAARARGPLGRAVEALLALPWAVPGTVFALALATAFSVHQPSALRFLLIGTFYILPLAYLVRSLPVLSRATHAGLRQLDPRLEEAAASLGAGTVRRLRRVVLPMLRPALVAGATLAFATAMGDFVTSEVLYTYETRPIAIEILSSLRLGETGVAAAYGVLLMTLSTAAFLLFGEKSPP